VGVGAALRLAPASALAGGAPGGHRGPDAERGIEVDEIEADVGGQRRAEIGGVGQREKVAHGTAAAAAAAPAGSRSSTIARASASSGSASSSGSAGSHGQLGPPMQPATASSGVQPM